MKTIRFSLLAFLLSISLKAQTAGEQKGPLSFEERTSIKVEYFGELVLHPGLNLGLDYQLYQNNWTTIHADLDLGGYWHRWNNNALFLNVGAGSRFALGSGFVDLNLGLGYMHSWADGTVYQRAADGGVEEASNWGHAHFRPSTALLFGWDGTKKQNAPYRIYFGPELYLQSSYNHIFLPHLALKLGFSYKIDQL